jgi:hypothetical protein
MRPPVDPPATTFGNLGLLLDVDVDEFTGSGCLNAAHNAPASSLEVREPRAPVAGPHPMQRRGGHPGSWGESGRSELVTPAQFDEASLHLGRGLGRAAPRATRAVLEARPSRLLVAAPPFVCSLARDSERLRGRRHGPALFDQPAEPESTLRGKRSVTVQGEPPWRVGV